MFIFWHDCNKNYFVKRASGISQCTGYRVSEAQILRGFCSCLLYTSDAADE